MPLNVAENIIPIKTAFTGVSCANCMESNTNLVQCSRCKRAKYCNRSCQKDDWKKHKVECQLLNIFKETYHTILPGDTLLQKTIAMQSLLDKMVQDNAISPTAKKHWSRHRLFMQYARVCSVCKKSQYDFDDSQEQPEWVNCPTCQFGWCCSQEHFDEYKSKHHTDAICACFVNSIAVSRFRWQHAKNYDDTFLFLPQTARSQAMKSFPTGWEEYFQTRCPDMYNLAKVGRLPPEFFPAATDELSQPATCLYAMYMHGISSFKDARTLTIHVVGASTSYELFPTCVWEEIMHCLPSVTTLNIAFVGPEACESVVPPTDMMDVAEVKCCPACVSQNRTRTISSYGKTYHEYKESTMFLTPNLIVAFNTGMHEECVDSWRMSLEVILDMDVASMFTSYDKAEADQDYEILRSLNAKILTRGPVLNPVRVDHAEIEACGMIDAFFYNNMYCVGFKGRV